MSHRTVKHALVDHLTAGLPGYGHNVGADGVWVAAADAMPADNSRWPFTIVRTTRMTAAAETGDRLLIRATYRCEITCGVRSDIADPDESRIASSDARDDLLDAIRNTLRWSRKLADGMRVAGGLSETTAPSVWEKTGQAIALGTLTFDVSSLERIPAPTTATSDVTVVDADVTILPRPFNTITLP